MHMIKVGLVVAALALCACDRKEKTSAAAPAGSAAPSAAAAPAPVTPATGNAGTTTGLPAKLGDKEGVVFAEQAGGAVQGIADGTRVTIVSEDEPMAGGDGETLLVIVKHAGKDVKLPAASVITEAALNRSPDGKHAVYVATTGCGDLCHTVIWLISSDSRRTKLGEGGVSTTTAWHPAGSIVAVSSGSTWLINLADHKVTPIEDRSSPAFAADGTLYLRDADGAAYTYAADGKMARVWKPKKKPKRVADDDMGHVAEEEPPPVKFVDGKPKFELE